ncbi:MAG: ATP synthase F1 subunit delta [Thermoanaerobaculaceae bacterium]|nr:ATP synthase F1 subunit delta [Thermoanaerobaculaceae bacterium]
MSTRVARPYAAALFQVLAKQGLAALNEAREQLEAVASLLAEDRRLLKVFEVPSVTPTVKRAILQEMGARFGLRREVHRLLAALMQHYRLRWLGEVAAAFRDMVDTHEGKVRGVLQTPVAPPPGQRHALEAALAEAVGARVELALEERPELLAGFVVRIGSRVFDGSLRTQLAKFAQRSAPSLG